MGKKDGDLDGFDVGKKVGSAVGHDEGLDDGSLDGFSQKYENSHCKPKNDKYLIVRNKCSPDFGKDPYQIGANTYFPESGINLIIFR